jgi:hypothetical protein
MTMLAGVLLNVPSTCGTSTVASEHVPPSGHVSFEEHAKQHTTAAAA